MLDIVMWCGVSAAAMYLLVMIVPMLLDEKVLLHYLRTDEKAQIWVQKLGEKNTAFLSRRIFMPLCIVTSVAVIGYSIWSVFQLLVITA